jgi:hypothetical protein
MWWDERAKLCEGPHKSGGMKREKLCEGTHKSAGMKNEQSFVTELRKVLG